MEEAGHPPIRSVFVCGGLSKNPLYVSSHADAMRWQRVHTTLGHNTCALPPVHSPSSQPDFTARLHSPTSKPDFTAPLHRLAPRLDGVGNVDDTHFTARFHTPDAMAWHVGDERRSRQSFKPLARPLGEGVGGH
eukprot:scaffold30975_cov84-Isochrysis_galbana.AAC.1